MEDIVLPDTSLCAIVRDEKMNPAGGIMRFLRSVMPHVEKGVVVDTGSRDGTRELLEEAQKQFPHLRVYDTKFTGYAQARNVSLEKAKTKRVLVLDADEIIRQSDYQHLLTLSSENEFPYYYFLFKHIIPELDYCTTRNAHNLRLFEHKGVAFEGTVWEFLKRERRNARDIDIEILHFLPSQEARQIKRLNWYACKKYFKKSPSQVRGFKKWKEFNPKRNNYVASNLDVS